jgi:rhodanese-related sulfurtransferase
LTPPQEARYLRYASSHVTAGYSHCDWSTTLSLKKWNQFLILAHCGIKTSVRKQQTIDLAPTNNLKLEAWTMKRRRSIWMATLLISLLGASVCMASADQAVVQTLSPRHFKALLDRHRGDPDVVLLDVRTPKEFEDGHIEGAFIGRLLFQRLRETAQGPGQAENLFDLLPQRQPQWKKPGYFRKIGFSPCLSYGHRHRLVKAYGWCDSGRKGVSSKGGIDRTYLRSKRFRLAALNRTKPTMPDSVSGPSRPAKEVAT